MKRRKLEDFTGFRFGNIHSSELGLTVVSSSKRYDKNLMPSPSDYTQDAAGSDGSLYYGSTFKDQEFIVNVAFDNIDEPTWRKISQIFATDKPQDLVFDELPFKTYKAKIKNKPDFKQLCFTDKETGQRVYKGEGKLTFVCYYPYAFAFNKYLVRAADDYYTPHQFLPIDETIESPYTERKPFKQRSYLINNHWKPEGNMDQPWRGGYPTIEQVKSGELYFTDPHGDSKLIIDTRAYWSNIPEWQCSAQLLVSPTLDQDGELIYLPQYSKINYYNMDTGLNNENGLIGSRLLVYNPGDLSVDFELKLGNLSSSLRRNLDKYIFRISRYNVQRLTIEQAVDWTGLTTYKKKDNEDFKYNNRYFKIIEPQPENAALSNCCYSTTSGWNFSPYFRDLGCSHPHHTYIVEPIPREKLGYFIKLFFWQSEGCEETERFLQGVEMANKYDELYSLCITDEERYELYWKTLSDLFQEYDDLSLNEYIYNPPEFFIDDFDRNFGEFEFNRNQYPSYYTFDYLDINNEDFDTIYGGEINRKINPLEDARREYTLPLFLNSDQRMLYNLNKNENRYNLKCTKNVHNGNIEKGHWFKLPPGWSLIDISPVIDKDKWGGKRWLDARPFEWGTVSDNYRNWYNEVYKETALDYLCENITERGIEIGNLDAGEELITADVSDSDLLRSQLAQLTLDQLENYMQFPRWYNYDNKNSFNKNRADWAEIGFLKLLANYWRVNKICDGKPVGSIDDWWWYANNYIWENFPPLYWGYADLLNIAQIKYTPLFY